jgi:hypothetical protein
MEIRPVISPWRLVSVLGEHDTLESYSLEGDGLQPDAYGALLLPLLVTAAVGAAAGWSAIKGYERTRSMPWGLAWGALSVAFPLPALIATAVLRSD